MKTIATMVGARLQFIKVAPVSKALAATGLVREVLTHTGQHHDADMSDIFFEELGIAAPNHHLDVHGGGHGAMTGAMMQKLEPVLQELQPDRVLSMATPTRRWRSLLSRPNCILRSPMSKPACAPSAVLCREKSTVSSQNSCPTSGLPRHRRRLKPAGRGGWR